ncbi:AAA family ATPase [Candidatus Chloroploca sp. Khr17]|uniref:AAA family ATPase n=1 Tax=Candidatus Chloroploca sp. Khr17 TaxID=2496869 RepID=UPI0013EA8DF4|nr:AAA family ATPase [Candidatus Chloroploca sp. Khr17]
MTPTPGLDLTPLAGPLTTLQRLEADLAARFLERDDAVRTLLVAVLAQQHVAVLGPPGTAKSLLVERLAARITTPGSPTQPFVWLLTRFTTPDELFGPISVVGLKRDEYRRITRHKLPEARFAFLDEIFKANSAILNALLALLNERVFDNGPTRLPVPLVTCVGAANELPQGDELAALWDRFALRFMVGYVSEAAFPRLLRLAALATPPVTISEAALTALHQAVPQVAIPDPIIAALAQLRTELAGKHIVASDRRWRQSLDLLRAHALLEGRGQVEEDDLTILREALWQTPEQRSQLPNRKRLGLSLALLTRRSASETFGLLTKALSGEPDSECRCRSIRP